MSPSRTAAVAAGVALLGAVALATALLLLRDDELSAGTGELIAYGCKETDNDWYAVCVMSVDGSDKERLTTGHPTTDAAWSPDGRRIAFTRHEEVGESQLFSEDDVYVMDADGDGIERLTPTSQVCTRVSRPGRRTATRSHSCAAGRSRPRSPADRDRSSSCPRTGRMCAV